MASEFILDLVFEEGMGGHAPSSHELNEAAERAGAEAMLEPSIAMVGDYVDLLVKRGYLAKKRLQDQDNYKPTRKFGLAWADATVTAVTSIRPELLDEDMIGAIALEMTKKLLGLDKNTIVKGRNPEEFARLSGVIVGIGRQYFGAAYIDQVKAALKEEVGRSKKPREG